MSTQGLLAKGADPSETLAWNMKLISHHELGGFGGMGEGMNMQLAPDGRRILWLAHESAPKNFTGVDVSDPRNPKVVVQTELPHRGMRSNSLDVVGNTLTVAYQTTKVGEKPAGFDIFEQSLQAAAEIESERRPLIDEACIDLHQRRTCTNFLVCVVRAEDAADADDR